MIAATVEFAKSGKYIETRSSGVDEYDLLTWAIDFHLGRLDLDSTYNEFREKITRAALRDLLRSMEGNTYDVHGALYKVVPNPPGSNLGRRMILADEAGLSDENTAPGPRPEKIDELENDADAHDTLHTTEEMEANETA